MTDTLRKYRAGQRVRCIYAPPAQLAGQTGRLVRSIQRGKQWLIQMDAGEIFDTPIGKSDCVWLWTCDFEPATSRTAHDPAVCTRNVRTTQFCGKSWKSQFTCPTCGLACWQNLNFLGRRDVVCDGLRFSKRIPATV